MIPLLIGITLISFIVIHLAPGEPTDMQTDLNPKSSVEMRDRLRERYNLDKPLYVQYGLWIKQIATLDFGESFAQVSTSTADQIARTLVANIHPLETMSLSHSVWQELDKSNQTYTGTEESILAHITELAAQ